MHFEVAPDICALGLRGGAIVFHQVRIAPAGAELRAEIAAEARAVQARYESTAALRLVPEVAAFHEALRRCGANPRRLQPSVERLLAMTLKRGDLPAVNNLVDAYNLVSLRSRCSLGAHDLDRIALPVSMRLLTGEETFVPLGVDQAMPVVPGEYGYVDARDRLLCRLDVLQADFSKVTEAAVNVLLIVEGTDRHSEESLQAAVRQVIELITRTCGGEADIVRQP